MPTFSTLASLPAPVSSSELDQQPEYPSVLALSATTWAVATGLGSVYVLSTSPDSAESFYGSLTARYDLSDASGQPSPFVLHAAHLLSASTYRLLLSRTVPQPEGKRKISSQSTTFELLEAVIDGSKSNGVDQEPDVLEVAWKLIGGDAPFWCTWSGEGWVVFAGEEYREAQVQAEETEEERTKREAKEKAERLGLGATLPEATPEATEDKMDVDVAQPVDATEEKVWPFSWTQTYDSVAVKIPLPSGTTRKDITVDLTSSTFSLSLASSSAQPPLSTFLRTPTRQFWTTIDPETSTYSFDTSNSTFELELAKVDENTRWPSVFAPPEDDDDDEAEDEEVPETLSQSMLDAVRSTFSNIKQRSDTEPEGNHPAIPALLREEMDYDLEDGEDFGEGQGGIYSESGPGGKVGREVFVGYIVGGKATWSKNQSSVVSLPLDGEGVIIKSAVDGLLFEPASIAVNPAKEAWKHVATSPALSFVLSSKRDTRIVRHVTTSGRGEEKKGAMVLAFDAGGSGPASGNVYVYCPPTTSAVAKQGVVRVSGGERGAMLGVGEVTVGGRAVVVVLCEKELVVLHGLSA